VDKRRCLAWPSRHLAASVGTWVDVNARQGTPRYEQLQRKVIDALLNWRTDDGERVVAVALRRKDSHLLGYYGRCCADVTFHYNSGFAWTGGNTAVRANGWGANHGPQMPATFSRLSDNLAFYVLAGPGVKAGWRRDERRCGYVRLEDLLPTTCRAANLPAPRHATGAVRHELLR